MRMKFSHKLSSATCLEVFPLHMKELHFFALKARFKCCFSWIALWTPPWGLSSQARGPSLSVPGSAGLGPPRRPRGLTSDLTWLWPRSAPARHRCGHSQRCLVSVAQTPEVTGPQNPRHFHKGLNTVPSTAPSPCLRLTRHR